MYIKILKSKYTYFSLLGIIILALIPRKPKQTYDNLDVSDSDLTDVQAKTIADLSYTAMLGAGTDEEYLFDHLFILNESSFVHVLQQFGIRDDQTLAQWLKDDLSTSDFNQFANKFNIL